MTKKRPIKRKRPKNASHKQKPSKKMATAQKQPQQRKANRGSGQLIPRGRSNLKSRAEELPAFNTYEDYQRTVFQSLQTINIMLNRYGIIVFVSRNISSLLGYDSDVIVGNTLLNIVPDEEKDRVSQKIYQNLPILHSADKHIEFCCYLKTGSLKKDNCYPYEYVKFMLYIEDVYDESFESFIILRKFGPNCKSFRSSKRKLIWEERHYFVGFICVLSTQTSENANIDQSFHMKIPTEVPNHSDASSDTSISSTEWQIVPSESNYEIDPRLLESPKDVEFEVDPKFLLNSPIGSDESVDGDEVWEDPRNDQQVDAQYHMTINSENQKQCVALEDEVDPEHQEEQMYEEQPSQPPQKASMRPVVPSVTQEKQKEEVIWALSQQIEMLCDRENQQHVSLEQKQEEEQLPQSPVGAADAGDPSEPEQIVGFPDEDSSCLQNYTPSLQENHVDLFPEESEQSFLFGCQLSEESLVQFPDSDSQENSMQLWSLTEIQELIKEDIWLGNPKSSSEDKPFWDEASPVYRPGEASHFMSTTLLDLEEFEDYNDLLLEP